MRKGELPVPYIIALILGIVVVGILGYGFFVLGWKIPGLTTEQNCQVKVHEFCTQWASTNFVGTKPGDTWSNFAPGCTSQGVNEPTKSSCRAILGSGGAGAGCCSDDDCQTTLSCNICTPALCTTGDTSDSPSCSGGLVTRTCTSTTSTYTKTCQQTCG